MEVGQHDTLSSTSALAADAVATVLRRLSVESGALQAVLLNVEPGAFHLFASAHPAPSALLPRSELVQEAQALSDGVAEASLEPRNTHPLRPTEARSVWSMELAPLGRRMLLCLYLPNAKPPPLSAPVALAVRDIILAVSSPLLEGHPLTSQPIVGVYLIQDGRFLYVNEATATVLGRSQEDLEGTRVLDVVAPTWKEIVAEHLELRESGEVKKSHYTFRAHRPDGAPVVVEADGRRIPLNGRPAILGTLVDRTQEHLAQRQRAESAGFLESVVFASPLAILTLDDKGHISLWNPAAEAMLSVPASAALGQPVGAVLPGSPDNDAAVTLLRTLAGERLEDEEIRISRPNAPELYLSASGAPITPGDGPPAGAVVVLHDVTERRRAEQMEEQLRHADRTALVGQLTASVAHELANPLQAIVSLTSLLSDAPSSISSTAARSEIKAIEEQAERATAIIRDLLTFSRRQAGTAETIDVNAVVRHVVETRMYHARTSGTSLRLDLYEGDIHASLVRVHLEQVLLNLIVNAEQALERNEEPGRITVRTHRERGWARIEVEDNGPGLAEADVERVFEPFFTTKEQGEGTGLGLSVSRQIIESSNGTITTTNHARGGALFTIRLPLLKTEPRDVPLAESPPSIPNEEAPALPPGTRVLLVEDEDIFRTTLATRLRIRGCRTSEARNGAEALEQLSSKSFDAIVLDIRMPGLDGPMLWEILGEIAPETRSRVLFMTGDALAPDTRRFLESTGRPYITKPFTGADLEHALAHHLLTEE